MSLEGEHNKYLGAVDAGPTKSPSDVTMSRGHWSGPQTEAGRGTTIATLNPSRIGQTSRIPIEINF
jgi:hypothetical protein